VDKSQLLALYDRDQRVEVVYPDTRREGTPHVVRHIDNSPLGEGMVIFSRLNESNADEVIRQQVSYFESIGQDFEWKVFDYDKPADLKERLDSYGFSVKEPEALVVLNLEDAPEVLWQPVRHDVQRVVDPHKLAHVQTVEEQVWDEDSSWVVNYLGEALRNYPEQISIYVAYVDGEPSSASWIFFSEDSQFASLWGGATIRSYRNQGLYTALLAVRAQEARARRVRYLSVDASPMSRPILEKYGFELLAHTYACKWKLKSN
jgi:GNAT superfamily N-acetyltransferase